MPNRIRTLALMLGAIAVTAVLATLAAASVSTQPAPAFVSDTTIAPRGTGDVSGPCDEAEHADDPRCTRSPRPTPTRSADGDISGPCDEAEHANDPRCSGADDDDDRSGRRGGEDRDDDSNSGRGSDDDDDSGSDHDNSGPGSRNSGRDEDGD